MVGPGLGESLVLTRPSSSASAPCMPPMTTLAMSSFQYDSDHFSGDSTTPSMAMNRLPMIFRLRQVYREASPSSSETPLLVRAEPSADDHVLLVPGPLSIRAPGKVDVQVQLDQR